MPCNNRRFWPSPGRGAPPIDWCKLASVRISCPKCHSHYDLDDRLVPAGGAPVQCTSCKHVFIATGPAQKPAPLAPAPASPRPPPVMDSSQTQIFGRAPAKALGSVPRPPMRVAGAVPKPAPDPKPLGLSSDQTQIFGRAVHASPSAVAEPEAGGILSPADFPDPLPLAMPRGEIRHSRVELPPAELDLHGASQPDAAEWDLAPPPPSRARILAIGAVGLVLLAVVSVGISRWVARRKVAVPPEAVATYEKAIGLLRRDNGASRKKARGELEAALSSFPDYLEARAALVVTLALQSDDAQAANQHAQIASSLLTRQIAQVEERKSTGDWQNRANVLADQLRVIHEQEGPLRDQAIGLSKLAESAWSALLARATELHQLENPAVLRAEMVYLGTRGAERAASLASHYPSA